MFLLNNASQVDPGRLSFRAEDLKTIVHATTVERVGLVVVLVLEILIRCLICRNEVRVEPGETTDEPKTNETICHDCH